MPQENGPNTEDVSPDRSEEPSTSGYQGRFTAPPPDQLSRLIPQVEVLQLLGQGGMGAVYKARQTKLDRLVALKVLPSEAGRDPAFATRFAREARALARLNDPHIVAIHDFGESEGLYYFLMEFVDGVNLRHRLKTGALPPADVFAIMVQVCDALQYAHDQGIVHRDIKPENILVDQRGRVKIADFGLAKLLGQTTADRGLTASQQVMGTWHYMAPEQIEHPLQVDHRADIYSLGVVFYEMLTGGLPLGHFGLPSQRVAVDAQLDAVILRALAKEPEQRFQHVRDMKAAIEALKQGVQASSGSAVGAGTNTPATTPWLTAWTLICCLLVILPAFPAIESNRYPGMDPALFVTLSALYGVLVLLLIATSFIEPVPLWRPFIAISAGADVMILTLAYLDHNHWKNLSDVDVWVRICLGLGTALVILGTFQLRGVLMRLYRSSSASNKKPMSEQGR